MLRSLFDSGLVTTDENQRIRVASPFIRDAVLLRMSSARSHPSLLPDIGFTQSTWLAWALAHGIEHNPSRDIGNPIWEIGIALAGYQSRAWGQAAMLLGVLPQGHLVKPYAWGISQIVARLIERHTWGRSWAQWARQSGLPEQIATGTNGQEARPTLPIVQAYLDGLDIYLKAVARDTTPDRILAIALGHKKVSKDNHWVRVHAFSALRQADANLVVEVRLVPRVYHLQPLAIAVYNFAKVTESQDLQLAACEVLTSWGYQPTQHILGSAYQDMDEYGHRARILRSALNGVPGYTDWV